MCLSRGSTHFVYGAAGDAQTDAPGGYRDLGTSPAAADGHKPGCGKVGVQPPAHIKQHRDRPERRICMFVASKGPWCLWPCWDLAAPGNLPRFDSCCCGAGAVQAAGWDSQLRHGRAASGTAADPGALAPTPPPCTGLLSTPRSWAALGAVRASHCCHVHLSVVTSEP